MDDMVNEEEHKDTNYESIVEAQYRFMVELVRCLCVLILFVDYQKWVWRLLLWGQWGQGRFTVSFEIKRR